MARLRSILKAPGSATFMPVMPLTTGLSSATEPTLAAALIAMRARAAA